jgi:hypothetical protein
MSTEQVLTPHATSQSEISSPDQSPRALGDIAAALLASHRGERSSRASPPLVAGERSEDHEQPFRRRARKAKARSGVTNGRFPAAHKAADVGVCSDGRLRRQAAMRHKPETFTR